MITFDSVKIKEPKNMKKQILAFLAILAVALVWFSPPAIADNQDNLDRFIPINTCTSYSLSNANSSHARKAAP